MRCGRCYTLNREVRRFCATCGAPLPGACPRCGFPNLESERWCGGCGLLLGVGELGERRQVTVLFCDLVGSTALSTHLDVEELRDLIAAFQGTCAGEIVRFEGFIARYLGDGILAYFGWPSAREDSAERAVRAGLGIVEAVRGHQQEFARRAGQSVEVQVRVGIATGVVVVGDLIGEGAAEERAVVGETPNLAARLQSLAQADQVVVSGTTRRLVGDVFELESLGSHTLKGFADPIPAWCVTGTAAVESRFAARHGASLPLVGREAELALLADRWHRAMAGDGQVVYLVAEAGLGKSRLVDALRTSIHDVPHARVILQCSPYHTSTALHPLVEHLSRSMGPRPDIARLRRSLDLPAERATQAVRTLAMLLGLTDPEPDLPPPSRTEVLESATDLVVARARELPLLVVLEDAQWLDPSGVELIRELVERAAHERMLLVVTQRPEVGPPLASEAWVSVVNLDRLAPEAVAMLVDAVAGDRVSSEVRARIAQRGEGVPLFVEELARAAATEGGSSVPASLADALMARLDEDEVARELAQAASVLGREFSVDLLKDVAPVPATGLQRALDQLREAHVIVPIASDSGRFAFRQTLMRDLAYQSLLRRRRHALHAAAATALEERGREPELVAQHWSAGERPDRAVIWWERASDAALHRVAPLEAVALMRRALETAESLPPSHDVLMLRIRLTALLATRMRLTDAHADALSIVEAMEAEVAETAASGELANLLFCRGNLLFGLGRTAECEAAHQRALDVAVEAGTREQEANAWGGLGDAAWAQGKIALAKERFGHCVELASRFGYRQIEAANLPMLALSHGLLLELDEAIQLAERGRAVAVEARHFRAETVACTALGWCLLWTGHPSAARPHLERALKLGTQMGAAMFRFEAAYTLALCAPDGATAVATIQPLLEETDETSAPWLRVMGRATLARVASDPDAVLRALLPDLDEVEVPAFASSGLWLELTEATLRLRDLDLAEQVLARARQDLPPVPGLVTRAMALTEAALAWRRRPGPETRAAFEAAKEADEKAGYALCREVVAALLDSADFSETTAPPMLSRERDPSA